MKKEKMTNDLIASAEQNGLIQTLYEAFGDSVNVRIPLGKSTLDMSVDEVGFSVRASNCLKRTGILCVREAVDAIEEGRLPNIRNLGRKSYIEIKTKILDLGYRRLTEPEKRRFFYDMFEMNGYAG